MYNPGREKYATYFKGSHLPLGIFRIERQLPFELHDHDFTELVLICSGSGTHMTQNGEYEVGPGDVFVIPPGMQHGYRNPRDLGMLNILFYLDHLPISREYLSLLPGFHSLFSVEPRLRDQFQFRSRLFLDPSQFRKANRLACELEEEVNLARPGHELLAVSSLMQLIGYLSRAYTGNNSHASDEVRRIGDVAAYMEQHIHDTLRLDELAEVAHMSVRTLQRTFRIAMGVSPMTYLIHLRMQHACELLRFTDLQVTEISSRVGLQDSNYFARLFREQLGQSPRQYRMSTRRTSTRSGPSPSP